MNKNKSTSALVIFTKGLPKKNTKWWLQFETVIAPKQLEVAIWQYGLSFVDIDSLIDPGNVQEASELTRKLSLLATSDGRRVSKIVEYKDFELWWIHYDDFMYKFCLPYTQYARLLDYLKSFSKTYIYKPPFPNLFQYFLDAHKCKNEIENEFTRRLPLGIIIQIFLSIPFLFWLKIRKPKLMLWTSDLFDGLRDHDFRMRFIYEELQKKKINFAEFVRSMESSTIVIQHAFKRKRPVIYSFAIVKLAHYLADIFGKKSGREPYSLYPFSNTDSMQIFWFTVATSYLNNYKNDIWAVVALKTILKFIGIKASIIPAANSRNFHEVLACKLSDISIVGILHGVPSKTYPVYDFMPEFDGKKTLSVDKYGLWSEWWRKYYLKNSKAYRPEQLFISGPMRPLQHTSIPAIPVGHHIKVLFASEQLAAPMEILPYLVALMEAKDISLYFKFRPYRDGFEEWLKINRPDILKKMDVSKIMRGTMVEAIAQCDVVVGSHTGGVLEALLQLRPLIFFRTPKWGDYFELESLNLDHSFIAENSKELLELVRKCKNIPQRTLQKLQYRFFGDPHMNGSRWVVEQVEKFL